MQGREASSSKWISWVAMLSVSVAGCSGSPSSNTHSNVATNDPHTVNIAARGPIVNVRRAPASTPSADAPPTLVTVRERGGSSATSSHHGAPVATLPVAPTPPTATATATGMPSEGGYIVRGTTGTRGGGGSTAMPRDRSGAAPVTIAAPSTGTSMRGGDGESAPSMPARERRMNPTSTMPRPTARPTPHANGAMAGGASGAGRAAVATDEMTAPAQGYAPGAPAPTAQRMPIRPVPPPPTTVTITVTTPPPVPPPVIVEAQQAPANLLTAASVGDADRRENYLGYLTRHGNEAESFGLDMSRRVRFRVVDAQGRPVNDAQIALSGEGLQTVAHTHADGTWDFYPGVSANGFAGRATAHVSVENVAMDAAIDVPQSGDGAGIVVQLPAIVNPPPPALDLQFLIDVTGSMGDELRYVNREVASIVQRIEASAPGTHVRVGATFYRDRTDQYVVQQIPFTTNVGGFATTMQQVIASGGGDYPEDMNAGLEAALTGMEWSEGAATRVLVVIADAPPQPYADENYTWTSAMNDASRRGIRLLPVAASGADRSVEFLFRAMGAMTTTPYVYLTDESGIGAPHMEADTDRVAVERFNDLLTRLVISDLRGEGMHEPVPSHI